MKIWQDDKNRLKAKTESGPSGWTVKERGSHWLRVSPAVADDLSLLSFLPEPAANVGQDGFSPLQEPGNRVAKSPAGIFWIVINPRLPRVPAMRGNRGGNAETIPSPWDGIFCLLGELEKR